MISNNKISVYQIQADEGKELGFFKKIGEVDGSPKHVMVGQLHHNEYENITIKCFMYVLSKDDIITSGINLPMVLTNMYMDYKPVCRIWLHFNTIDKLKINNTNFDQYVEEKLNGYFSLDCYYELNGSTKRISLEILQTFPGPTNAMNKIISHINSDTVKKIIDEVTKHNNLNVNLSENIEVDCVDKKIMSNMIL